jgi:hypothetical protein
MTALQTTDMRFLSRFSLHLTSLSPFCLRFLASSKTKKHIERTYGIYTSLCIWLLGIFGFGFWQVVYLAFLTRDTQISLTRLYFCFFFRNHMLLLLLGCLDSLLFVSSIPPLTHHSLLPLTRGLESFFFPPSSHLLSDIEIPLTFARLA